MDFWSLRKDVRGIFPKLSVQHFIYEFKKKIYPDHFLIRISYEH